MKLDPFTRARLCRTIQQWRENQGSFPTLKDLTEQGFSKKDVQAAVDQNVIVQLYVKLTNGSTVKGYKVKVTI